MPLLPFFPTSCHVVVCYSALTRSLFTFLHWLRLTGSHSSGPERTICVLAASSEVRTFLITLEIALYLSRSYRYALPDGSKLRFQTILAQRRVRRYLSSSLSTSTNGARPSGRPRHLPRTWRGARCIAVTARHFCPDFRRIRFAHARIKEISCEAGHAGF